MTNATRIVEQLNAAAAALGERCSYALAGDAVALTVEFRGTSHSEPIWCEVGLRYAADGGLDPAIVARTHSNTKFRLTKRLQRKYMK